MNPAAQSITGLNEKDTVGKHVNDVFPLLDVNKDVPAGQAEIEFTPPHGERSSLQISVSPLLNKESTTIGSILILRDITQKKRVEQELQKAQRLESIGLLAGGIAHDFNNFLMAVMGNISVARIRSQSPDIRRILSEAEKACSQAKDLTQQLLTFARGGSPQKKTMDIRGLLEKTVNFPTRGTQVKVRLTIHDELWLVEIDENQIIQVINNLMINAIQSMPEGGYIDFTACNCEIIEQVERVGPGRYINLKITDRGIGIDPEYMDRIFDPYFTTKASGSGLGLAISYSIVRKHDGYISVDSNPEGGTTVDVYLPALQQAPALRIDDEEAGETDRMRLLLMDDQPLVLTSLSMLLNEAGFDVDCVSDGLEAVERYNVCTEC